MVKRYVALLALAALIVSLGACKKKDEQPITGTLPESSSAVSMPSVQPEIVVPEDVKNTWKAVVITIEDKAKKTSKDVTIAMGSTYNIENSNIKIEVGSFLPDFKMSGATITSSSNEPNNPAVRVTVYEGDAEIFKGWLYSNFPAIHPFQHESYGLTLKEGVKKS